MDNKAAFLMAQRSRKVETHFPQSTACLFSLHLFASIVCSYTIEAIHTFIILRKRTKSVQTIQPIGKQ